MKKHAFAALCVAGLLAACAGDPPPDARATTDASRAGGTATDQAGFGRNDRNVGSGPLSDAQRAQLQEQLRASAGDRVFFLTDKSDLTAEAQRILTAQAGFMRQYANLTFTIEGHADERGTREYNLALGDRRAAAVRKFLLSSGIQDNRIRTVSYGKERPQVALSNDQGWAQNRRGVTVID
jgi:peptidoglycan-associated lipoprotein